MSNAPAKRTVAIVGAAGYTGGEALDILLGHPGFEVVCAQSNSQAGKRVDELHPRLRGRTQLAFAKTVETPADAWLLCTGHGRAAQYLIDNPLPGETKVVDLSRDFRLAGEHDFVYGLPEAFADDIRGARAVANPGCFATAIQLALLPLARAGLLEHPVSITAVTGSTGAGQAPSPTTHFSWRADNLSVYKPFTHQHLDEIRRTLGRVAPNGGDDAGARVPALHFVPVRGDFARGIFCVAQTPTGLSQSDVDELYAAAYARSPRTFHTTANPDLQQVVRTDNALVHPIVKDGQLGVISVLDNLRKGASGQAVENLELMFAG